MADRILELADGPARLHVRDEQLVIDRDGWDEVTTPLEELGVLVISHPRVQMTQSVLARVAAQGGSIVVCDEKHLPAAMVLPVQSHFLQTERFAMQTKIGEPARKRLWQQIVQAKILAQGRLLEELHGDHGGLVPMSARVKSGDPDNLEAQASRRYWPLLFADPKFRRGREGPDQNSHLNYGYAVLRGVVARSLCATGLHPSLGLQHCNRYNPFCLADDLMEPFRPLVDRAVAIWVREHDPCQPLSREAKQFVVQSVLRRYEVDGEARSFFDIAARTASSLAKAIMGESKNIAVPTL